MMHVKTFVFAENIPNFLKISEEIILAEPVMRWAFWAEELLLKPWLVIALLCLSLSQAGKALWKSEKYF